MKSREEIFFRASGNGALMTDGRGTTLTDKMKESLVEFKAKIRGGIKLGKTDQEKYLDYLNRENTKPELSDTAKEFVQENWLWNEKGFYEEKNTYPIQKGNFNEQESISMLSRHTGNLHLSETKRIYKDNLTGLCDTRGTFNGKKIVFDIKNSWNPKTFMNAGISKLYDWQGETYMNLYDADEFWLVYTLTDCPRHIVDRQKEALWRKFQDESMTIEEQQLLSEQIEPLLQQIENNLVYSDSGRYTEEERIKIYKFERNPEKMKLLKERIPAALDYYQSLTLNKMVIK